MLVWAWLQAIAWVQLLLPAGALKALAHAGHVPLPAMTEARPASPTGRWLDNLVCLGQPTLYGSQPATGLRPRTEDGKLPHAGEGTRAE